MNAPFFAAAMGRDILFVNFTTTLDARGWIVPDVTKVGAKHRPLTIMANAGMSHYDAVIIAQVNRA